MFLPQAILKVRSESSKSFIEFNISHVILKSFVCNLYVIRMSIVCIHMPLLCHSRLYSYVIRMSLVCTRMYSYVIRMSLVCTRMSSVCHSYVIRMSLVCTRMSPVCHSYVLVCHPYVTRMYSHVIRMSLVCSFTMNL